MASTSASPSGGISPRFVSRDFIVPLAVVFLVALFLVPVPAAALDFLLVTNVVLSLALLLRAVLVRGRIELAAFPALLLISTLFRLGLNVSSTRLILLRGDEGSDVAGRVIETFGTFVVGGDFVVGAIVFGVIALVNFIVITRGAARVAEVSARFSLDALPGRQLAIDADQRNGSISSAEADRRRDELSRESQFFGSMDGAMRFVQGDAIATLVIVVINALGGMILGASRGLDLATSMQTFGVLAIGDGLVSIIPSLLVSVSAGIVVTNSSGRDRRSVGESLPEMFADPRALALSGLVVVFMGFIPGFPLLPFSFTGLALVGLALRSGDPARRVSFRDAAGMRSRLGEIFREPPLVGLEAASTSESHFAPIRVEIPTSESGTSIVDVAALQRELDSQRDELFRRRGVRLPAVTVSETPGLASRQYRVRVRERIVRSNELPESGIFVPLSRAALSTFGFEVVAQASHPLTPQSAAWVRQDGNAVQILKELEIESIDLTEYLALETVGAALSVIEELFGVDEVRGRVEELRRDHPHVVSEVLDAKLISFPELAELMRGLVREQVSVRDLKLIFEGIAEYSCRALETKDRAAWRENLHSHVRTTLSRAILDDSCATRGVLRAFVLSPELEEGFRDAVSVWDGPPRPLPLEPNIEEQFRRNVQRMFRPVVERGALPVVILCSGEVRAAVHEALRTYDFQGEWYTTVAFEELGNHARTETVGVISL